MKEKVLSNKKKGMFVLLLTILVYLAAIAGCIVGGFMVDAGKPPVLLIICIVWLTIGWVPLCGLKVLKPDVYKRQEYTKWGYYYAFDIFWSCS